MRLALPGKLRIAQVAPLSESVPPKLYGGTERVVSVLTDELVRQGHAVTLFASGDSRTSATLVAACPQAQRLMGCVDPLAAHMLMIEQVAQRADEFDIIHFHVAPVHFPIARRMGTPHLTTLHGRLDLPDLRAAVRGVQRTATRLDLRRATRAAAASELGRHRPSWISRAGLSVSSPGRFVSRISWTHRPGEASRSGNRDRQGMRMAPQDCSEGRPERRPLFKNEIAPLMEHPLDRVHRRDP